MIFHEAPQGTPEWLAARLGKPTASTIDRLVTAKKLERSSTWERYASDLAQERVMGKPLDETSGPYLERGTLLEPGARDWYAFQNWELDVREVGFATDDSGRYGFSADAMVGETIRSDDGERTVQTTWVKGTEIKCPGAKGYLWLADDAFQALKRGDPRSAVFYQGQGRTKGYRLQIQFGLWVSKLPIWDAVLWNPSPDLPNVILPIEPEPEVFDAFDREVPALLEEIDAREERAREMLAHRTTDDAIAELFA